MKIPAMAHRRPIIGITCDTAAPNEVERCSGGSPRERFRYESPGTYARAVVAAGGVPVLLPYHVECIGDYLAMCDGFLLSGGDDPDTTPYGEPVHPAAKLLHPRRQEFETALLAALDAARHPVLGICLGMQMMALHHGGRLHQHLPDAPGMNPEQAAAHRGVHDIVLTKPDHAVLLPGAVDSSHHQAVAAAGNMRVVATRDARSGGVIEAIDAPQFNGRFYLGVQWHPERTASEGMGQRLIDSLVHACGQS